MGERERKKEKEKKGESRESKKGKRQGDERVINQTDDSTAGEPFSKLHTEMICVDVCVYVSVCSHQNFKLRSLRSVCASIIPLQTAT